MFACKTSSREAGALDTFCTEIITRSRGSTAGLDTEPGHFIWEPRPFITEGELKGFSSSYVRTPTFQPDESQEGATIWASKGAEQEPVGNLRGRWGACGAWGRGARRHRDLPATVQRMTTPPRGSLWSLLLSPAFDRVSFALPLFSGWGLPIVNWFVELGGGGGDVCLWQSVCRLLFPFLPDTFLIQGFPSSPGLVGTRTNLLFLSQWLYVYFHTY